jgi:hypothetical protein
VGDIEHDEWLVNLPRTRALWRAGDTEDIEDMLLEELTEQVSELMGESGTYSGGWPEDEQVEVLEVKVNEQHMEAKVRISFTEVIPSGCKDMPHCNSREVELLLTVDRDDDRASVDYSAGDPEGWETGERNSAADGM